MKATRPRIHSITGDLAFSNLNMRQSWNQEYFPREQYSTMWQQLGMKKSTQSFSECPPQQFEQLVSYYKKENQDIQLRNNQLVQTARLLKDKQSFLLQEIAVLQAHYRKLQKSSKIQSIKQPFKQIQRQNMITSIVTKQDSPNMSQKITSTEILTQKKAPQATTLPLLNQKQALMESLNKQFCQIVEESIKEKDQTKRKLLRKELAELASEMKKIRAGDFKQDISKKRKLQRQIEDVSKKTLKPYIKGSSLKVIEKPSKI